MTDSHIRYGIIGCGMMGREHIRNISLLDDTGIAAIYEPDLQMQQAAAELAPTAVFADDIASFVGRDDIDAVVIASPNYLHIDQIEALMARPGALLVEKPLYTDPAGPKAGRHHIRLWRACVGGNGISLYAGHPTACRGNSGRHR